MRLVMIVGQPGSGKSTLAREMGARTGLPVVHIDRIHWSSGWVERSGPDKAALCARVHARDAWIFEGGHSPTWPERLERCDTLIWLDVPLAARLRRVVARSLRYRGRSRPDLPEGCPERLRADFLRYIWKTRNSGRARIARLFDSAPPDKAVFRLKTLKDVAAYLETLGRDRA